MNQRLIKALDRRGYTQRSYFAVPRGFAVATQMERMEDDGDSWPVVAERWQTGPVSVLPEDAGVLDQLWMIFGGGSGPAHAGRYRVIVFVVTTAIVRTTGGPPSAEDAQAWMNEGGRVLPAALGTKPFTPDHEVVALVYEFRRPAVADRMRVLRPSPLTGDVHLRRAGLLPVPL